MRAALSAACSFHGSQPAIEEAAAAAAGRAVLPSTFIPCAWRGEGISLLALGLPLHGGESTDPPLAREDSLVVQIDGTLDNSRELATELRDQLDPERSEDRCHLVLAAYRRWGLEFPRHLIGEFALVLWDDRERLLLAARDPFGVRSLFYTVSDAGIVLGSQVRQLLDPAQLSTSDLDEEYLADFLASCEAAGERTAFRTVSRLKASHALVVRDSSVRTFRYWDLEDPESEERLTDTDHLERFRELFREAVGRCLGSRGRVWAELSGGLDSSSIVSMTRKILDEDGAGQPDFETVTFTWPDSRQSDERQWAETVLAETEFRGNFISGEGRFFAGALEESRYRDDPHFVLLSHPLMKAEADLLRDRGVDVLLSGAVAEAVVLQEAQEPFHLADLLRNGRLGEFFKESTQWQSVLRAPMASLLWAYALRPLVRPGHAQRAWDTPPPLAPWLTDGFVRRTRLADRRRLLAAPRRSRSAAERFHYELLRRTDERAGLGHLSWSVELRLPFLYRPLVQAAYSAPWRVKIGPGRDKRLLRDGLAGVLPDPIRRRKGWKSPTYAAFRTFSRRWPEISEIGESSLLVELGLFDRRRWQETLQRAKHGAAEDFAALTSSIALEYWLRSFFGKSAAVGRARETAA